jgi:hypothetical protein
VAHPVRWDVQDIPEEARHPIPAVAILHQSQDRQEAVHLVLLDVLDTPEDSKSAA